MRTAGLVSLVFLLALPVSAQVDGELSGYIASRRKVMDDASRPIAERETVALEVAATLDRAAWASTVPATRRAAWSAARSVLDGFSSREKDHPKTRLFAFQSSVYLWAEAQSWAGQAEREPTDREARARAASSLDGAIARLRPLAEAMTSSDEPLAQNLRFRLARALADRAKLDPNRPEAAKLRGEALAVLQERPTTETNLKGHVWLLVADLLGASGQFERAKDALAAAAKSDPAPPFGDRLAVLVPIAVGMKEFETAKSEIDKAPINAGEKSLLRLRLDLAERATLDAGKKRAEVEADVFRRVQAMKSTIPAEFRLAVLDLARAVDEPVGTLDPDAWSLLAEGAALLGQYDRAARLDVIASAKLEGRGDASSARTLRFRAAAILFQAGRFARADAILSRIVEDRDAGPLRPRAGMLRALARGRGLAAGESGLTRDGYVSALVDQVRLFPDDPSTGEARWPLGRARLDVGDRAEAETMWNSVPRSHDRWLDSRLALAALRRNDLEIRRLVDAPTALARTCEAARSALARVRAETRDDAERADVNLEEIRLELVPGVGDPKTALNEVQRLLRLPLRLDQRSAADRLNVLAMAVNEKFLDAEQAANALLAAPEEGIGLARDLDHAASVAQSERTARRIGGVERIVAARLSGSRSVSPAIDAEIRLRKARGRMLSGDFDGARGIMAGWSDPEGSLGGDLATLLDLADLFLRIGDFPHAISVYRLLARRTLTGSPQWFAARLGHAQTLRVAKQTEAARKLVAGTALLHPDLGGPAMKDKFEAIQRKLERPYP